MNELSKEDIIVTVGVFVAIFGTILVWRLLGG